MKKFILKTLIFGLFHTLEAQYYSQNWFALPYFTPLHADRPVYIQIKATHYHTRYSIHFLLQLQVCHGLSNP